MEKSVQLVRGLARALEIETVKCGSRAGHPKSPRTWVKRLRLAAEVFAQGDQGTSEPMLRQTRRCDESLVRHFYIIRQGAVSVEIDGCQKRRQCSRIFGPMPKHIPFLRALRGLAMRIISGSVLCWETKFAVPALLPWRRGIATAPGVLMLARMMCQDTELWKMGKETFQEMMPGPKACCVLEDPAPTIAGKASVWTTSKTGSLCRTSQSCAGTTCLTKP